MASALLGAAWTYHSRMTRTQLERHQVWWYLVAVAAGLAIGSAFPTVRDAFSLLVWPMLAVLLYATFVQVPLLQLRDAFRDRRFVVAVVSGNFIVIPAIAFFLVQWLPPDPALRLGVLLVLLVPCTDWFVTFAQLGGGDTSRAMAITPLNLVLQLVLLPVYLWWSPGGAVAPDLSPAHLSIAVGIVIGPLLAAAVTERWMGRDVGRLAVRERLGWAPVPLLATVVFLIAGAQVAAVFDAVAVLPTVVPAFAAFLLLVALAARGIAWLLRLPASHGRTLCFSMGTRNSFLVLPLALALPEAWSVAAVVVVVQSLVELIGMIVYLWWVPRHLFRR